MEYKPEPYPVSGDLFEIPAAEQEVTVGSNDHNGGFVGGTGGISMYHASQNPGNIIVQSPVGLSLQHHGQTPNKMPRIIMLQRAGQPTGLGISGGQVLGSSGLKAVKIITVPGQGIGGKPIRAAVIPRNMLQRNIKVVTASGIQQNLSMARTVFTGGAGSVPRVLTLRPAGQLVSQGGNISTITPVRTRNLFLANPNAGGFLAHQQRHDELDTGMTADRIGLHAPGLHGPSGAGGYFELAPGPQFVRPCSPNAGGSGDEQDHNVATGMKTNGLRRYARCVCNKVKEKGITSYSEVADELVHEYAAEHPMIPSEQLHYIQKNIRRRVYDALNVLMALKVLHKEKKEIRWVGLPVNMIEECRRLEEEREKRQVSLRNKIAEIQELILQLIAFKNLVMRNRLKHRSQQQQQHNSALGNKGPETALKMSDRLNRNSFAISRPGQLVNSRADRVELPFLVISTHRKTVIDCNISNDRLEYQFNFDQAFEIRDEVDTLKRMGLTLRLGTPLCTQQEYNTCLELVPPSFRFYVEAIYERRQAIVPDFEALHQQRRLYAESRLAAAAAAAANSNESGVRPNSQGVGAPGVGGTEDPNEEACNEAHLPSISLHHQHFHKVSGSGLLYDPDRGPDSRRLGLSDEHSLGHHGHSHPHHLGHGHPGSASQHHPAHPHHLQHHSHPGQVGERHHGHDVDDEDEEDEDVDEDDDEIGADLVGHVVHPGESSGGVDDLVPGDTQHYARTAASRGFLVPGGPGGLLRHRGGLMATSSGPGPGGSGRFVSVAATSAGCSVTAASGCGSGGVEQEEDSAEHIEDMSAAAALVAGGGARPSAISRASLLSGGVPRSSAAAAVMQHHAAAAAAVVAASRAQVRPGQEVVGEDEEEEDVYEELPDDDDDDLDDMEDDEEEEEDMEDVN